MRWWQSILVQQIAKELSLGDFSPDLQDYKLQILLRMPEDLVLKSIKSLFLKQRVLVSYMAALTSSHELDGLKQQELTLSQLWRSEVQNQRHLGPKPGAGRAAPSGGSREERVSLLFSFRWLRAPLTLVHIILEAGTCMVTWTSHLLPVSNSLPPPYENTYDYI